MKKLYYFLLLLPLWGFGGLFGNFAFAQVSVELMGKTPPQVFFTVSWGTKAPYNNKIWVLAQVSTSGIGSEERALITDVIATGATASTVTGHRGFWLETSGDNGSATVTATLNLADGVENFNWCVYAFDYPPNAVAKAEGGYMLRGSPPFIINGDITEQSNTFGPGTCITSITDATDNPEGIVPAPTIAWSSGGEMSQTFLIGNAITPITFVTAGATSVTPSGLPNDVSGAWSSPDYTVSGAPSGTGTYNYTLTATDVNGCSATVSGTITVMPPGVNQQMGGCTFTQPELVSTFANFPATYSVSTFVTLQDERDRNNYTVVKMPDGKWWMAQNLNYQTGLIWQAEASEPSTVTDFNPALIGHFWCPGVNNVTTTSRASCNVWGALYSWETAMMRDGKYAGFSGSVTSWPGDDAYCATTDSGCTNTMNQGGRGICPPNWHVPTDAEWGDLFNAMETGTKNHNTGTDSRGSNAGAAAKAVCYCGSQITGCAADNVAKWNWTTNSVDTYGFRLLAPGARIGTDWPRVFYLGYNSMNWSSSVNTPETAWYRQVTHQYITVIRNSMNRAIAASIRCVMD
jgi:uncharacterized protein (TIGR02145 family)